MQLVTLEGDEVNDDLEKSLLGGSELPEGTEILELHGEFEVNGEDEEFFLGDFTIDSYSYLTPEHKNELIQLAGDYGLNGDELSELNGLAFLKALGKFKMPKLKMPKIKIPKLKIPKLKIPKIKMPKIKAPKFKMKMKMPKLKMPKLKMPKLKMPNFKMPDMPGGDEEQEQEEPEQEEPEETTDEENSEEATGEEESEETTDETGEETSDETGEEFSEDENISEEMPEMSPEEQMQDLSGEGSIIGDAGELLSTATGMNPLASAGVNIGARLLDRMAGTNRSTAFLSSSYNPKPAKKPAKKIKVKIKPKPEKKAVSRNPVKMKASPSGKFALTRSMPNEEKEKSDGKKSDDKNKMMLYGALGVGALVFVSIFFKGSKKK